MTKMSSGLRFKPKEVTEMLRHYVIQFRSRNDYIRGLEIASNLGLVECRPHHVLIVSSNQFSAIKEEGIPFDNGKNIQQKN